MASADLTWIDARLRALLCPSSVAHQRLWRLIVRHSCYTVRARVLRDVNHLLRALCHARRRSDRAKQVYVHCRHQLPFRSPWLQATFEYGAWRVWSADKAGFADPSTFARFCALGDVDTTCATMYGAGRLTPQASSQPIHTSFTSRTGDVVIRVARDPRLSGYAHYLGVMGEARKVIAMRQFFYLGHESKRPAGRAAYTEWTAMEWGAGYI